MFDDQIKKADFQFEFIIDSKDHPEMDGGYYACFDFETNSTVFFKTHDQNGDILDHSKILGEDFQQKIQEMNPKDFGVGDFESLRTNTFTEKQDFGEPFYNHASGQADYRDNWQVVEVDPITREIYNELDECWESGDEHWYDAIQRFFGLGYKNPRQFE